MRRGRGGRRWVCFWIHFFCIFFEHFSSTPLPPPTPHPGGGREHGWGWGEGGVSLDWFLEFLEGVRGYGRGRVVYIHTHALQTSLVMLC